MIAIAYRPGLERGCIRPRPRFCQAIAGKMLHGEQLRQIAAALLAIAETVDHPGSHIVNGEIGRGGDATGGQFLENHRRVVTGQTSAAELFLTIDTGKAERCRLTQGIDREDFLLVPLGGIRGQ